ncbi:unnamed protein product [Triticum turgidum subsp. durum]|uniref:UBC core domain-containing protein n=2 Tax=Triticum TaxID=4564 RepID=A0A9R1NP32_TRITD|nr:unnamed protein product [Triticum turgidum subsp. durum]
MRLWEIRMNKGRPYLQMWREVQVTFKTRIYHCNVDSTGAVSLEILKDGWSPALTISKVLLAIKAIITNPDPYNPLVESIARLYLTDRAKHDEIAAEWTLRILAPCLRMLTSIPLHGGMKGYYDRPQTMATECEVNKSRRFDRGMSRRTRKPVSLVACYEDRYVPPLARQLLHEAKLKRLLRCEDTKELQAPQQCEDAEQQLEIPLAPQECEGVEKKAPEQYQDEQEKKPQQYEDEEQEKKPHLHQDEEQNIPEQYQDEEETEQQQQDDDAPEQCLDEDQKTPKQYQDKELEEEEEEQNIPEQYQGEELEEDQKTPEQYQDEELETEEEEQNIAEQYQDEEEEGDEQNIPEQYLGEEQKIAQQYQDEKAPEECHVEEQTAPEKCEDEEEKTCKQCQDGDEKPSEQYQDEDEKTSVQHQDEEQKAQQGGRDTKQKTLAQRLSGKKPTAPVGDVPRLSLLELIREKQLGNGEAKAGRDFGYGENAIADHRAAAAAAGGTTLAMVIRRPDGGKKKSPGIVRRCVKALNQMIKAKHGSKKSVPFKEV